MDKAYEIFKRAINNKISQDKMKDYVADMVGDLEKALKIFKETDQDELARIFLQKYREHVAKAYREKKITQEHVRKARFMMAACPNDLTKQIYEAVKGMYNAGASIVACEDSQK